MSFFKKITKEFDNLGLGSKDEDRASGGSGWSSHAGRVVTNGYISRPLIIRQGTVITRDSNTGEGEAAVITSRCRCSSTSTPRIPEVAHLSTNNITAPSLRRPQAPSTPLRRTSRESHPDGSLSMTLITRGGTTSRKPLVGLNGRHLATTHPATLMTSGDMAPTRNMAIARMVETMVMDTTTTMAATPMVIATLTANVATRRRKRRAAPAACFSARRGALQSVQLVGP